MSYNKEDYNLTKAGHYFDATFKGNPAQSFFNIIRFKKILKEIKWGENVKVMDIGCGPGTLFYLIHKYKLPYGKLLGLDIASDQIEFAKNLCKENDKISFICKDATELETEEKYDYVIFSELIEHLSPKESIIFLKKIKNYLKEDGIIIFTTPNYRSIWPLIEVIWSFVGKINYLKQHINRLNLVKVKKVLKRCGYVPIKIKSHFIVGFLFAYISRKLARKISQTEEKLFPRFGTNMIVTARKSME